MRPKTLRRQNWRLVLGLIVVWVALSLAALSLMMSR
jgi:hypothetical protein